MGLGHHHQEGGPVTLDIRDETDVLRDAEALGFTLVQRELDTGQLAWVWRPDDDGPRPAFLTRRQAIAYMDERLRHFHADKRQVPRATTDVSTRRGAWVEFEYRPGRVRN
jgi:hypothetical protein